MRRSCGAPRPSPLRAGASPARRRKKTDDRRRRDQIGAVERIDRGRRHVREMREKLAAGSARALAAVELQELLAAGTPEGERVALLADGHDGLLERERHAAVVV